MSERLRIFISSPGDVPDERLRADLVIDRLAQDYQRFFSIESYRWEHEPMLASGHFQEAIAPPSEFDIVVLILWSRLGTPLPENYHGIDGRVPVTGTEWEYEDALKAARERGAPDILAFRNGKPTTIDALNHEARGKALAQLDALDDFWRRHFADRGTFLAAFSEYRSLDEFSSRLEQSLRKLIERRVKDASSEATGAPIWMGAPFRGLEAYEFEHSAIFFGRGGLVTKAAEQIAVGARAGSSFLLVSGPSGSGKSSLVKAALVPALMRPQRIEGAAFLRRATFRPAAGGKDLIIGLVEALTRASETGTDVALPELLAPGQTAAELAAHLRGAADQPGYVFASALAHLTREGKAQGRLLAFESAKLILVVDQLEELFTVSTIKAEDRQVFVRLLAGLARSGVVWVIATLRADFWHRVADLPELMALAEGSGRLDVAPPSQAEIADMIRKPAQAAGLVFETHPQTGIGLDSVLAEHAVSEAGVLPLLSFTLDALYRQDVVSAGGHMLTYGTYEKLGGLEGAIATRAEEVVAQLPERSRAMLPRVLRSLATVSGSSLQGAVARVVPLSAFPEGSAAREVVDAFTAARLMVASSEGATPTVRFAHEALMSRWERARDQLTNDRRDLETRALVERQMTRWSAATSRSRNQLLLRDPDLANAVDLVRRWNDELDPELRAYIAESERHGRFRQRVFQAAAASFAVLFVVSAVALFFAAQQRNQAAQARDVAQEETRRAEDAAGREKIAAQKAQDGQRALSVTISDRLVRPAVEAGRTSEAIRTALDILPADVKNPNRPLVPEAMTALIYAINQDRLIGTLSGHDKPIWSVAFSPDGKLLATGSADHTVRLYDISRQQLVRVLRGHEDVVTDLAFTHDSKRLISVGGKDVVAWDVPTGAKIRNFVGHERPVQHILVFPDDQRIVTSSWDNTVRIWRLDRSEPVRTITGPAFDSVSVSSEGIVRAIAQSTYGIFGSVDKIALSADGKRLIVAGYTLPAAWIFDTETGDRLATLSGHRAKMGFAFHQVAFDRDGMRVATASGDGTARLWDANTGEELAVLGESSAAVQAVAFTPNGERVVTAGADGIARLWDGYTGRGIAVLSGHASGINSLDVSPDGRLIVTGAQDGSARLWDTAKGNLLGILREHAGILTVRFSPDGRQVVTAGRDSTARLWRAEAALPEVRLPRSSDRQNSTRELPEIVFSPTLDTAVSYVPIRFGDAPPLTLVNLARRQRVGDLQGSSPQFTRDGRRLVTVDSSVVRLYDAASGQLIAALSGGSGDVAPSGDRVAVLNGATIALYDTERGAPVAQLMAHRTAPSIRLFDRTGKVLLTSSTDGAWLWDTRSGTKLAQLSLSEPIKFATMNSIGSRLLTISGDNKATLWSLPDGRRVEGISRFDREVMAAAFSPDGKRLVTTDADGSGAVSDALTGRTLDTVPANQNDRGKWKPFAPVCGVGEDASTKASVASDDDAETCSPFGPDGAWLLLESGGLLKPGAGTERPSQADLSGRMDNPPGAFYDNRYVMISEGRLLVVDLATGRTVTFGSRSDPIRSQEVFPDLDRVVTISAAGVTKIWRIKDGTEVATLDHPGAKIESFSASINYRRKDNACATDVTDTDLVPNGMVVATRGNDNRARLWSGDGQLRTEIPLADNAAFGVGFASSGCRLVVQTADSVRLVDSATGREIADLKAGAQPEGLQTDVGAGVLLVKSGGGRVDLYRQDSGRQISSFTVGKEGDTDSSDHFALSESLLVAATKEGVTLLVDLASGKSQAMAGIMPRGSFRLTEIDKTRIVVSDSAGAVWLIEPSSATVIGRLVEGQRTADAAVEVRNRYVKSQGRDSAQESLVETVEDQRIVVWSNSQKPVLFSKDGQRIAELNLPPVQSDRSSRRRVLAIPNSKRFVVQSKDGRVSLWNSEKGSEVALPEDLGPSQGVQMVPNDGGNASFAAIGEDGAVVVIDALSGRIAARFANEKLARSAWSGNGEKYAAAFSSDGNSVEIRDRSSGKILFSASAKDAGGLFTTVGSFDRAVLSKNGRNLAVQTGYDWSLWHLNPLRRIDLGAGQDIRQIALGNERALLERDGGTVELRRTDDGALLAKVRSGSAQKVFSTTDEFDARFLDQERRFSVPFDGKLAIFDASDGSPLGSLGLARDSVVKQSTDPSGRYVQTVSAARAIRIAQSDGKAGALTLKEPVDERPVQPDSSREKAPRLNFSADGKRLIVSSSNYSSDSAILDVANGATLASGVGAVDAEAARMLLNSKESSSDGTSLDVVDIASGDVLTQLAFEAGPVSRRRKLSIGGDDISVKVVDSLFSIDADRALRVWDVAAGKPDDARTVKLPFDASAMAASPDGSLLAIGGKDGRVVIRKTADVESEIAVSRRRSSINRLVFDPASTRLIAGSEDGRLELIDVRNRQSIATLSVNAASDAGYVFSPEGERLAVLADKSVALFDSSDGRVVAQIADADSDTPVYFSPNGRWLALIDGRSNTRVIDAHTGAPVLTAPWSSSSLNFGRAGLSEGLRVSFSPNSELLLAQVDAQRSAVWDIASGKRLFEIVGPSDLVHANFTSDGQKVLTVYQGGVVRLSRASDGERASEVADLGTVAEVTQSPDQARLYVRGPSSTRPRLIDATSGTEIAQLAHGGTPSFRRFSSDSRYLITYASDGSLRAFDTKDGRQVSKFPIEYFTPSEWNVVSTAAGLRLVGRRGSFGRRSSSTQIFDGETGEELANLEAKEPPGPAGSPEDATQLSSGARRVIVERNGVLRLFDGIKGTEIGQLGDQAEPVTRALIARNGSRVASWSGHGKAQLWDGENGRLIQSFGTAGQPVVGGDLSPSGDLLVLQFAADPKQDTKLALFDTKDGTRLRDIGEVPLKAQFTISTDGKSVVALTQKSLDKSLLWLSLETRKRLAGVENITATLFSEDGRYLAVGLQERIALFDSRVPGRPRYLEGHAAGGVDLAFVPGGKLLVTAGSDGQRVWDLASATLLRVIPAAGRPVRSVAVAPDGARTATIDDRGDIAIWRLESDTVALNAPAQAVIDFAQLFAPTEVRDSQSKGIGLDPGDRNEFAVWVNPLVSAAKPTCTSDASKPVNVDSTGVDNSGNDGVAACEQALVRRPDDPRLRYLLGQALEDADRPDESVAAYRKAADGRYGPAIYRLGQMYMHGEGGLQQSLAEAAIWFRAASDAGEPDAAAELGLMNFRDAQNAQAREAARQLLLAAAERGSPIAHNFLATEEVKGAKPDWSSVLLHRIIAYRLTPENHRSVSRSRLERGIAAAARKTGSGASSVATAARAWTIAGKASAATR